MITLDGFEYHPYLMWLIFFLITVLGTLFFIYFMTKTYCDFYIKYVQGELIIYVSKWLLCLQCKPLIDLWLWNKFLISAFLKARDTCFTMCPFH